MEPITAPCFLREAVSVPTVRRAVAGYLDRRGCESEASLAVALVITELASNVVLHAYPHTRGVFEVSILPADGWIGSSLQTRCNRNRHTHTSTVRARGSWHVLPQPPCDRCSRETPAHSETLSTKLVAIVVVHPTLQSDLESRRIRAVAIR